MKEARDDYLRSEMGGREDYLRNERGGLHKDSGEIPQGALTGLVAPVAGPKRPAIKPGKTRGMFPAVC